MDIFVFIITGAIVGFCLMMLIGLLGFIWDIRGDLFDFLPWVDSDKKPTYPDESLFLSNDDWTTDKPPKD